MTTDELTVSYAVKINGGSGVLVGALSQEYTYVFTAKHVLGIVNQVTRDGIPLRILNDPFLHPTLDCAILQVEFLPDVTQRHWIGEISAGAAVSFVGYPNTNMGTATPFKVYIGQLNSINNDMIVCNLDNGPQQDAIVGMSGGGVYHIYNGYPYLLGIEHRMDDEDENLRWGRIRCISLKPYESILAENNLAFIAPSFMKCFSQLKDDIFHFNAARPENVLQLNNKLREYAQALVDAGLPPPHDFMLKQQNKLLVGHEPHGAVLNRDLWVAYFEFVIVCVLIDDPENIDGDYLSGLESRRRFVYSSSNAHWIRHLSEMLKAARLALDEHGVMIINSPQEEAPHLPDEDDLEDVIDDIASAPKIGAMPRIDNVHGEVYRTYTVTHMKGLRNEYVLKKHRIYGTASASSQLTLFRDFYNEVIK